MWLPLCFRGFPSPHGWSGLEDDWSGLEDDWSGLEDDWSGLEDDWSGLEDEFTSTFFLRRSEEKPKKLKNDKKLKI